MNYLSQVNAPGLYLMVGAIIGFVLIMCVLFLVRSYKAGLAIGMDKAVLKKTIRNSAVFTVLPSVGILVGVIALSGALGAPLSWMRLSVVGALQYELNVADIAAKAIGLSGLNVSEMSAGAFATVSLVMTVGILGGGLCCIFFLGRYLRKLGGKKKPAEPASAENAPAENAPAPKKRSNIGNIAMVAMFIGLCTAYISSYIGTFANDVSSFLPLLTACVAAAVMLAFTALAKNPRFRWVENFDVALSMLIAMAAAVIAGGVI
ncbi:MAG: DUF5058 family protein [Clostridia bacterium]|nr:DUF5058 family protein [Clostridia bacterium]